MNTEPPKFEDVAQALEGLVAQLEAGELPLDEALKVYERGVGLARTCNTLLEGAERRIEILQRSLGAAPEEGTR